MDVRAHGGAGKSDPLDARRIAVAGLVSRAHPARHRVSGGGHPWPPGPGGRRPNGVRRESSSTTMREWTTPVTVGGSAYGDARTHPRSKQCQDWTPSRG